MPQHKQINTGTQFSPTIIENYEFLRALARTRSPRKRKRLLKKSTTAQLLSIVEICLNILRNRFGLTVRQKKRMTPFVEHIRKFGRIRSERGARRQIVQKGGQLPIGLFASLLTPIITELARSFLSKHSDGE